MPIEPTPEEKAQLLQRQAHSQRSFYRALATGAERSRVLDLSHGLQATIIPARPWFSIFNAVIYDDPGELERELQRLDAVYREAEIGGWSVWVRPDDLDASALLAANGFREEASPLIMGAPIGVLNRNTEQEVELEPQPTWAQLAVCNDRAHGLLPEFSMTPVFESMNDPASQLYAARSDDGEIASALLVRRVDADCYFWLVATIPEAQGQGLAAELIRLALRDAFANGCSTATLESTVVAEQLYERLGFIALGRNSRWSRYASQI